MPPSMQQPPPPSFEHQFLPRWNNFVDLETQDSPKINHPYFMSKFIGSERARIAAKNATQRATDEPRPERSGKKSGSECNTKAQQTNQGQNRGLNPRWVNFKKALQHTLGSFASGIEKPRWVSTSRLTIVNAIKKPEMHCKGVILREEKSEEGFREILLEEKRVEEICMNAEMIERTDVKSFNTPVRIEPRDN